MRHGYHVRGRSGRNPAQSWDIPVKDVRSNQDQQPDNPKPEVLLQKRLVMFIAFEGYEGLERQGQTKGLINNRRRETCNVQPRLDLYEGPSQNNC